jgi:hypothetical protein
MSESREEHAESPAPRPSTERDALRLARKRDAELTTRAVAGLSHQEVMESVRRTLRGD